ncbi:MAG: Rho termination factor N-terminal domain-containing protein, partial [Rhodobacter sp.]|nr:Rho termination factor N-terminal domain-containing protein [Rhodobacter sp.]
MTQEKMFLSELKAKSPADLLAMAEELEIENATTMRKGDMMFAILKENAEEGVEISGDGVLEVMQDGFGFLRSPEANYLPGPDDIYVSPTLLRKFSLRTGDTVMGVMKAPEKNESYFGLTKVTLINFADPELAKHKVHFDNLTPLYPDERLIMEIEDPTIKDKTARVI